jgi:ketopantoate reductase
VLLISPSSLKNLSNLHQATQALVTPNHTIILIESTYNIGLHSLIEAQFPNNPVCSVSTQAKLRLLPAITNPINYHSNDPLPLLLHSGHASKTWLSVPRTGASVSALSGLIHSLQNSGIEASASSTFDQLQWNQVIPTLAFQPLTIMLEACTPAALLANVLSKPLYTGIISELMAIAAKHTGFPYDEDYLREIISEFKLSSTPGAGFAAGTANDGLTPSPTASTISTTSNIADQNPFSPAYLEAPILFYEYFHGLPIAVDLLLLQPILMASDFGIKTPYLETMFAYLTQMMSLNSEKSESIFIQRKTSVGTKKGSSAGLQSSEASARERSLDEREHQLQIREKQLDQREQKLNNWSGALQRMQNQQQQQQQQSGKPGGYRPMSAMPVMGNRNGQPQGQQQRPDPNMTIDMMQMTNRRNRRLNSTHMLRTSASTASLTSLADSQQYHANNGGGNGMGSSMSMANGGTTSVASIYRSGSRMGLGREPVSSSDIDSYSSITADRYGIVDSRQLSRSRSVMQMAIPETGPIGSPNLNAGSPSFMIGNNNSGGGSNSSGGSRNSNNNNMAGLGNPNSSYPPAVASESNSNLSNGYHRGSNTSGTPGPGEDPNGYAEETNANPYTQFAVNPYSASGPTASAAEL